MVSTLEYGWDKQYGGLFYFMDRLGKPPQQVRMSFKSSNRRALSSSLYLARVGSKAVVGTLGVVVCLSLCIPSHKERYCSR